MAESWLAIGENCMPLNALRRFALNSPSTPFSSARCCIEHVTWLESIDYKGLLDHKNLILRDSDRGDGKKYVYYSGFQATSLFKHGPSRLLEFAHQNPFESSDNSRLLNRADKMLSMRKTSAKKIFFYHHRSESGYSIEPSKALFRSFKYLSTVFHNSYFLCVTQRLVKSSLDRGVDLRVVKPNICMSIVSSLKAWGGHPEDFHGMPDDDLLGCIFHGASSLFEVKKSSS